MKTRTSRTASALLIVVVGIAASSSGLETGSKSHSSDEGAATTQPFDSISSSTLTSTSTSTSPVTTTALPQTTRPVEDFCSVDSQSAFLERALAHHGIQLPKVKLHPHSAYLRIEHTIEAPECETGSALAHEAGHFVLDRAHNYQLEALLDDVITNFCPGGPLNGRCQNGWIKGEERFPGLEHAAHCIGNVLVGTTPYTKCPIEAMRALAEIRIEQAR